MECEIQIKQLICLIHHTAFYKDKETSPNSATQLPVYYKDW